MRDKKRETEGVSGRDEERERERVRKREREEGKNTNAGTFLSHILHHYKMIELNS